MLFHRLVRVGPGYRGLRLVMGGFPWVLGMKSLSGRLFLLSAQNRVRSLGHPGCQGGEAAAQGPETGPAGPECSAQRSSERLTSVWSPGRWGGVPGAGCHVD